MKAIEKDIKCIVCEASLRGTTLADRCPHCNYEISATIASELVDQDSLTVITDVSCTNCDYNLRSMSAESRCPECGEPVYLSTSFFNLSCADTYWLQSIKSGLISILVFSIGLPAILLLTFLTRNTILMYFLAVIGFIPLAVTVLPIVLELTVTDPHFDRITKKKSRAKYFFIPTLVVIVAISHSRLDLLPVWVIPIIISAIILHVMKCLQHVARRSCIPRIAELSQIAAVSVLTTAAIVSLAILDAAVFQKLTTIPQIPTLLTILSFSGIAISLVFTAITAYKLNSLIDPILKNRIGTERI